MLHFFHLRRIFFFHEYFRPNNLMMVRGTWRTGHPPVADLVQCVTPLGPPDFTRRSCTLPASLIKPGVAALGFAASGCQGSLMHNSENPNVGHSPHGNLPPIQERVGGSKPSIPVLWGNNSESPFKLFPGETPWGCASVAHNANKLINPTVTGLASSTISFYFLESPCTKSLSQSVCRGPSPHLDGCSYSRF